MEPSTSAEVPANKINVYYKIRTVFPNFNIARTKDIIINPNNYGIEDNAENDAFINDLTEYLLNNGADFVDVENLNNRWQQEVSSSEMQSERLIGIFPNADPDFLRNFAKKNYQQPIVLNHFIEENLMEPSYPTRDEYVARRKKESDFEKYFINFDVNEFIKEFPDPFQYFEGRKSEENHKTYKLLCDRFKNLNVAAEYKACNYNATLTAKNLEKLGTAEKFSKDSIQLFEDQMPEFAFICHREMIENHLKNEALQISKNEILECEICLNTFSSSKCSTCNNGHVFCNSCISSGVETKISDAVYSIKCFSDCGAIFSDITLKKVLNSKLYNILEQKQLEIELSAIENLESCPFCEIKSETQKEDKILKCRNQDCLKESCRECKKQNHLPYECQDVLELRKARLYVEEKMTKALIRTCHNCRKQFIKLEGCNRMQCPSCLKVQCYLCDQPVAANDYRHFNGQGSDRHDLCPLYTDDKYQEAEAVREVALKTKEEILKKNPDFDVEMIDSLIPALPERTAGPHDDIRNANQLSEHALKVVKATFLP